MQNISKLVSLEQTRSVRSQLLDLTGGIPAQAHGCFTINACAELSKAQHAYGIILVSLRAIQGSSLKAHIRQSLEGVHKIQNGICHQLEARRPEAEMLVTLVSFVTRTRPLCRPMSMNSCLDVSTDC